MKRKVYFIFSSIIQILCSAYLVVTANAFVQAQIDTIQEMYAMFPVDFQSRMIDMLSQNGVKFIVVTSVIDILLNLLMLKAAISDNILKKKGLLIAFSLICFFTTSHLLVSLLSLVNFIVLLASKRKNPEDYPVKEKLPTVDFEKPDKKGIILAAVLIAVYLSQLLVNHIVPENASHIVSLIITIAYYVTLPVLCILFFRNELVSGFKILKNNYRAYIQHVLPKFGIMYVIFITVSLISILISQKATSENQSLIESMPLWFTIPAAVIWAPIVEELVFRGALRRFLKNNYAFIIVSAIAFGLMHTVGEDTLLNVVVLALPYSVLGGFFAYIYTKTNNIITSVLCHALHNTLAMTISSLLLFII